MRDFENEGGPAFGHGDRTHGGDPGMSLRDWFAGQSLQVFMRVFHAEEAAKFAYALADAMLLARTKPTGETK